MTKTAGELHEIGMIGLGVMGRNFSLNMADHGFSVAGYDKDPVKVEKVVLSIRADRRVSQRVQLFFGLFSRLRERTIKAIG